MKNLDSTCTVFWGRVQEIHQFNLLVISVQPQQLFVGIVKPVDEEGQRQERSRWREGAQAGLQQQEGAWKSLHPAMGLDLHSACTLDVVKV